MPHTVQPWGRASRGWGGTAVVLAVAASGLLPAHRTAGADPPKAVPVVVPVTWDEEKLSGLEVPLAHPGASAKHASKAYYESTPLRPIYKSYDVYHPDREPKGYLDSLRTREPEVVWDDTTAPPLNTEADWVKAGEAVFDSPLAWGNGSVMGPYEGVPVRDAEWYKSTQPPLTADGKLPFYRYVVRKKGSVEVGVLSCAMCHIRVLRDQSVVKGAQGNFPFGRAAAYDVRKTNQPEFSRRLERQLYGAPWLRPDPLADLDKWSAETLAAAHEAVPAGVLARHGTGAFAPVQVPDLIGVEHRKYLDRTGLVRHRGIGDLMRYAALNQGADLADRHGDFRPLAAFNKDFLEKLPPPAPAGAAPGGRYSDAQLYALAKYVYSLKPPPNPHRPATESARKLVARGEPLFDKLNCARCHGGDRHTNDKLTPVDGFAVSGDRREKDGVLEESVGTDPTLALGTRRGTGFYKVPSLKGVWYVPVRSPDGYESPAERAPCVGREPGSRPRQR